MFAVSRIAVYAVIGAIVQAVGTNWIERVMPPPRRRMTMPSKTWIRSRLPSTTLADTLTVSPGSNFGMSVVMVTLSPMPSTARPRTSKA